MDHSEEIQYLDVALGHCSGIKANLLICALRTKLLMAKFPAPNNLGSINDQITQFYSDEDGREESITYHRPHSAISMNTQRGSNDYCEEISTTDIRLLRTIKYVNQQNNNLAIRAIKIRRNVEETSMKVDHLLKKYGETYLSRYTRPKLKARSIFKLNKLETDIRCQCAHVKSRTSVCSSE